MKEEHLITYKSGENNLQIDFIMTRRADLKDMRDCKVIPGEEVVSQHLLLCAVMRTQEETHRRRAREKMIQICTLKGEKEYRNTETKCNRNTSWSQTPMQKKDGNYLRKSS